MIALMIAAINIALLMWAVVNYQPHMESNLGVMLIAGIGAPACIIASVKCKKCGNTYAAAVYGIAAFVCIVVLWLAKDIPLCPECDQVTSEDLGWMNRWIKSSR